MSEPLPTETTILDPSNLPPTPPLSRLRRAMTALPGALAWLVIAALVVFTAVGRNVQQEAEREGTRPSSVGLVVFQMQARYLVGASNLLTAFGHDEGDLKAQAKALNTGSYEQRLRYVVVAGELFGADEARARLADLKKLRPNLTADQQQNEAILERLYGDFARVRFEAPSVPIADREHLTQQLGWFGELALVPKGLGGLKQDLEGLAGGVVDGALADAHCPDPAAREQALIPARRTFLALGGGAALLVVFGLAGLLGWLAMILLTSLRIVRFRLTTGQAPAGIYAETFAAWMALFLLLTLGSQLLVQGVPALMPWRLALGGGSMLFSLLALGWPVLRGRSWRQVREDIGLSGGRRGAAAEAALGLVCYAMALPLVALALALTLLLVQLQRSGPGGDGGSATEVFTSGEGAHPIVTEVAQGGFGTLALVFVLACVVAPLVEEIMFRGVLYRHLRELSAGLGRFVSVALSGLMVAFVFAVIHPQGMLAVPALMALALAFSLAREWRGTLLPAMVAHGLNNGLVMLLLSLAVG